MSTASPSPTTTGTDARRSSLRRVAGGGLVGTSLEFYDHFIFGSAAALIFPLLFFPEGNALLATMLSLATYGVAFVMRPLGAVVFGHFGDRHGRRPVLVVTLVLMGAATIGVGLLPTYEQIGILAPLLLVTLRLIQGLALGGEWSGAALMVTEFDTTGRRRGFLGSLIQVASPIGVLLANGALALVAWILAEDEFLAWGWRIPFLASALLVIVGLWIRLAVSESPAFAEVAHARPESSPVADAVRGHWRRILIGVGCRTGEGVVWYLFSIFLLVYGVQQLDLTRSVGLTAQIVGAVVGLVAIPAFGALSDVVGRRPVIVGGALAAAGWLFVYFPLLDTRSPAVVISAAAVGMLCQAAIWGPLASFLPELFPTEVRASAAGVGFQVGGVLGGAVAPILSLALVAAFDSWVPVAIYAVAALAVVVTCTLLVPETRGREMGDAAAPSPTTPDERGAR